MKRGALILLMALVGCALAYLLAVRFEGSQNKKAKELARDTRASDLDAEAKAREQAAYEEQNRARVAELARLDAQRQAQQQLDAKSSQARLQLETARSFVWTQVITTNWAAYQALRDEAAHSSSKTVPCTLCDGKGSMEFCVLCEHSGKCLSCQGTGRGPFNERCPTCKGTGKCHLCHGSGKMPCPFCDDGVISLNLAIPSMTMMVPAIAVPAQPRPGRNITTPEPSPSTTVAASAPAAPAEPAQTAVPPNGTSSASTATQIQLSALLLLVGFFVVRKVVPGIFGRLNARFNPWDRRAAEDNDGVLTNPCAEHQSFAQFVSAFRMGPGGGSQKLALAGEVQNSGLTAKATPQHSFAATPKIKALLAGFANELEIARHFVSEISKATDGEGRQKLLAGLSAEIASFKRKSDVPELLPIWQLTSAVEGLLNQLARKADNVTASTLLTAAGAFDLLSAICASGCRPDLATVPPARLLVVDDDLISRQAVSFALKKAFNQPDVAAKGDEALSFAALNCYDAIFLDVEMPGMDGFELCSKIRQTTINQNAPVVFVTGHSDFDSREKSTRVGGQDLIAKPFLAFEITVKALTLILRGRLHSEGCLPEPKRTPQEISTGEVKGSKHSLYKDAPVNGVKPRDPFVSLDIRPRLSIPSLDEFVEAFRVETPTRLQVLKQRLNALGQIFDQNAQREMLSEFFVGIHALATDAERSQLRSTLAVASALEKLVKKLLERGETLSKSTLNVAVAALDLIEDLCRSHSEPDLATPPVRILVVDDDPILRRGLSGSLQLMFGKPETAESGEVAVASASENPFDMIFLDVLMPGIDGFTACRRIHELDLNRHTPIVFLTSLSDLSSRDEGVQAGGSGFISKPALAAEVTLTAITFCLRARLEKLPASPLECAVA